MLAIRKSAIVLFALTAVASAAPINVPNFSFESPAVVRDMDNPFGALPFIDDWDETAVGDADEFDQNSGVFLNTDPMSPDFITNAHLERLAFVSSLVGNDLRQQLVASYIPGQPYSLTVAAGTSAMFPVGSTEELEIALTYLNAGVEQVIGSTRVLGSQVGATALSDFSLSIPPVDPTDAWANQPIGILIRPAIDDVSDLDGEGFWNLDNVRLVPEPATLALLAIGGGFAARSRNRKACHAVAR